MPTPPLPLFQALLRKLDIPIKPTSISSIPPSLLLLTIEKILIERLPLLPPIRSCKTPNDELMLVKCLMGVMGDDELGMDLTAVDPVRVVMGVKEEMSVVIMGLIVIAKRRGIVIRRNDVDPDVSYSSTSSGGSNLGNGCESERWNAMDEEEGGDLNAVEPLQPDVTLSSPILPTSPTDVFGRLDRRSNMNGHSGLFGMETQKKQVEYDSPEHRKDQVYDPYDTPIPRLGKDEPEQLVQTAAKYDAEEGIRRRLRNAMAFDKVSHWREDSRSSTASTTATNSTGHRTVLQEMMDEFGLG